ncbi:Cytochrome c biogenesis protein CcsA [Bienertia sinuspersici]
MTLLVNEIVGLYNSLEKGMLATFFCITGLLVTRWVFWKHFPLSDLYESLIFLSWSFYLIHMILFFFKKREKFFKCNNCAKCYFYPSICYVGPLNSNASICNISTCSPISMVNDACKYDGIGLCGSFMRIIIISNTSNYYISKRYNKDF